jgi:hypothetical protein
MGPVHLAAEGAVLVAVYLFYVGLVIQKGRAARARAEAIQKEAARGPRLPSSVIPRRLDGGLCRSDDLRLRRDPPPRADLARCGVTALIRPLQIDSAANSAYLAIAVLYAILSVGFLARRKAWQSTGVVVFVVYLYWLSFALRL